ncbi:MAG: XisI protein [Planctomycetia bacterium]|nr:XisI protein [Planctomycetia bacterium]
MDRVTPDIQLIRRILTEHTRVPFAYGEIRVEPVFDDEHGRYLLMLVGRDNERRVHGCLVHVDIIDGKFWIQRDGTEAGIGNELVAAGVPRERIVLAFRSPELRKLSGFAVA